MSSTIEFHDVTVVRETHKGESGAGAILCNIEGEEIWIPKSVISDDSEVYKDETEGTLVIFEWFAEKEGMI